MSIVKHYPYLYFNSKPNQERGQCLFEQPSVKDCPSIELNVTSEFVVNKEGKSRFGKFRCERSRDKLFNRILSNDPDKRHTCTVITSKQSLLFYLDCEFTRVQGDDGSDDDTLIPSLLEQAVLLVSDVFDQVYNTQSDSLDDVFGSTSGEAASDAVINNVKLEYDNFWVFSASSSTKISLHVHADPRLKNVVWSSPDELCWFMKQKVKPELMKRHARKDASVSLLVRTDIKDPDKPSYFIDFSVYNPKTQNVKLPLCSKPGKAVMRMYHHPPCVTREEAYEERRQLEVGMVVVHTLDGIINKLLPDLKAKDSITEQPTIVLTKKRRRSDIDTSIEGSDTSLSSFDIGVNHSIVYGDARKKYILDVLRQYVGKEARIDDPVKCKENCISGTFCVGTALCGNAKRVHKSNRLRFYAHCDSDGSSNITFILTCFDQDCSRWKGRVLFSRNHHLCDMIFPIKSE